jgi:hypothetical protein
MTKRKKCDMMVEIQIIVSLTMIALARERPKGFPQGKALLPQTMIYSARRKQPWVVNLN